jgi:large subunit ribosomal protein L23
MALFWSKKPKAEKNYEAESRKAKVASSKSAHAPKAAKSAQSLPETTSLAPKAAIPSGRFDSASAVIIRSHITEKSGLLSQSGVYTFAVSRDANKPAIMRAVKSLYKVAPVKVAIANLPTKTVWVKGKWGSVTGIRKAIVTVKKGDKIDFV